MLVEMSYPREFTELMDNLRKEYPKEIFEIEGIGDDLDINHFSKKFFDSEVVADSSVDPSSNVISVNTTTYRVEVAKPLLRLDSEYVLWRQLQKHFNTEEANRIITKAISGDYYINDMHSIATHMPYCVAEGTRVLTDKGYRRIETLNEDVGAKALTRDGLRSINQYHSKKVDALYTITTKSGYTITTSADHKFLLGDLSWKKASCLREDDILHVSMNNQGCFSDAYQEVRGQKFDEDWGFLIGHLLGDGHTIPAGRRTEWSIAFDEQERQNYTGEILQSKVAPLIRKKIEPSAKIDKESVFSRKPQEGFEHGCSRLILYSVDFFSLLEEIGYDFNWTCYTKQIPEIIWNSPKSVIAQVIRAMFDCDGTICTSNKSTRIEYTSASLKLSQDLQSLLSMFGIYSMLCTSYNKGISTPVYKLKIYGDSRNIFAKEIGFFTDKKKVKLAEMKTGKSKLSFSENGDIYDPIVSIDVEYGDFNVYDIGVEGTHEYVADTFLVHNCWNFSTLDLVNQGMDYISKPRVQPPKSLFSFKSQLEQHIAYVSNSILGAAGIADLLIGMSYYVDKIFNTGYDHKLKLSDFEQQDVYVEEILTSLIYTLNQSFRSGVESPFTNLSVYGDTFLDTMCEGIVFPDGSSPNRNTIHYLQEKFMNIMNKELSRTPITFPVTTANFAVDKNHQIIDKDFVKLIAQQTTKFGFINIYLGDSATLSSCCRLRSNNTNKYFNSLGSGSSKIGSLGVVTVNLPRLAFLATSEEDFKERLLIAIQDTGKINYVKRKLIQNSIDHGLQPLYSNGFIDINKQYSTTGFNGIYEAMKYLGYDILEEPGLNKLIEILEYANVAISEMEDIYKAPHNLEQVPAETSAVKIAKKDRVLFSGMEGFIPYDIFSNQFVPLTVRCDMLDRIRIQGRLDKYFSGGSIMHLSIETRIDDPKQIEDLIYSCAEHGVVYFAVNYWSNYCDNGHVFIGHVGDKCPTCGGHIESFTRPVGYLAKVSSFNKTRRDEAKSREFYTGI